MLTDDRTAIENTVQNYVRALDGGDLEGYLATLTDDIKFTSKEMNHNGKQAIAGLIGPMFEARNKRVAEGTEANKGTRHIITNQALEFIDSSNAVMRSYWMFAVAPKTGGVNIAAVGSSEDYLIKKDGKWLIRERRIETL